uniref:Serpentine receptor class gamma n=1 Tax=Strongyloides venezuelensis TaxID=75913 RepID=A0A0K0FIK5_STRVS
MNSTIGCEKLPNWFDIFQLTDFFLNSIVSKVDFFTQYVFANVIFIGSLNFTIYRYTALCMPTRFLIMWKNSTIIKMFLFQFLISVIIEIPFIFFNSQYSFMKCNRIYNNYVDTIIAFIVNIKNLIILFVITITSLTLNILMILQLKSKDTQKNNHFELSITIYTIINFVGMLMIFINTVLSILGDVFDHIEVKLFAIRSAPFVFDVATLFYTPIFAFSSNDLRIEISKIMFTFFKRSTSTPVQLFSTRRYSVWRSSKNTQK